eukprot:TRINITY_DN8296_c0_g1_i1.p1 TRINITY_DN8296_c0_g1~~TRINITY_DN8296_c0_g1_i1.p1  ORF type:complete len:104 (-),score=29.00 TRINITY_DN8296_c0_g1_i1:62-373(-)
MFARALGTTLKKTIATKSQPGVFFRLATNKTKDKTGELKKLLDEPDEHYKENMTEGLDEEFWDDEGLLDVVEDFKKSKELKEGWQKNLQPEPQARLNKRDSTR